MLSQSRLTNFTKYSQSPNIPAQLVDSNVYQDHVSGFLGISNQHSAGTLMQSTRAVSIGRQKQRPDIKPYEGIDSITYQPESSFIEKQQYGVLYAKKEQQVPGTSLGKGTKYDFTKDKRELPGSNQYQDMYRDTEFKSFEQNMSDMYKQNKFVKGTVIGYGEKSDFTRDKRGIPGANKYSVDNIHNYNKSKQINASIGFGNKSDFTKETRYFPGPNQYKQIKSDFLTDQESKEVEYLGGQGMVKGPGFSRGPRYDFTKNTHGFPSPNQYNRFDNQFKTEDDVQTYRVLKGIGGVPGTGFGKGLKSDFTKERRKIPAPGDYQNVKQLSEFKDIRTQQLQAHMYGGKGMMKGQSFGKGPRSDFTKETRKIPGPGSYSRPLFKDNISQRNFQRQTSQHIKKLFDSHYDQVLRDIKTGH